LKQHLWRMSQAVAGTLQRGEVAGGVVAIKLRYGDFTTLTRQMTLPLPSDNAVEIYRAALNLLERAWEFGRPVRLLGVGAHQLSQPSGQLSLFDNPADAAPAERFDERLA
jgi:DNA polymerase-4